MAADGWADGRGGRLAAGWLWNLGDEEGESVVRDWDRAVGLDEGCEVEVMLCDRFVSAAGRWGGGG